MLRPLGLGEVIDTSFGLFRTAFGSLLAVSLITSGLPQVLGAFLASSSLGLRAAYSLLGLVAAVIGVAATTFIVSERYLGRPLPAGEAFNRAFPFVGRILVLWILVTLVIGVALMVFMVPALFVLRGVLVSPAAVFALIPLLIPALVVTAGLILAVPALVVEDLPAGSRGLSRSWELTRGLRTKVLLTIVVTFLLFLVPIIAFALLGEMFGIAPEGSPAATAVEVVTTTLLTPLLYVTITVLYYDARVRKEAFDLEMLAAEVENA